MRAIAVVLSAVLFASISAHAQLRPVGLPSQVIRAITAEQGDPDDRWFPVTANALFAATDSGMVMQGRTWDDGKRWVPIGPFTDPPADIVTLCVQHWGAGPMDGLHLFAAVRTHGVAEAPVLLRNGVSMFGGPDSVWERADSGLVRGGVIPTVQAMTAMYYSGHEPPQPVLAWTTNGPWRGSPGGVFWEPSGGVGGIVYAMDVTPKWFGGNVWAAGRQAPLSGDAAAYRSTDAGLTWTSFLFPRTGQAWARAVAVAPGHPDTAYVGVNDEVQRTTDGGFSWSRVLTMAGANVIALACDPHEPAHIYAASDSPEFSLRRSTDLGATWQVIAAEEEPFPAAVTCMTVALIDTVPLGNPARRGLFLGTDGTGVWRYEMADSPSPVEVPPAAVTPRMRVYPNPARGRAMLEVTLAAAQPQRLRIRDMLGRTLWSAEREAMPAGTSSISLPVDRLSPGTYIVSIAGAAVLLRVLR